MLSSQKRGLFPKDFLFWAGDGFVWLYMYEDGMNVPNEFDIIDFQEGLYAVATDIDQETDKELMDTEIDKFLSVNGFILPVPAGICSRRDGLRWNGYLGLPPNERVIEQPFSPIIIDPFSFYRFSHLHTRKLLTLSRKPKIRSLRSTQRNS